VTAREEHRREVTERFGENVRVLREARGLSQDDLAREMTERGWQYYQSTVYKIEHGGKVSFSESVDLAAILRTSLDRFTWTTSEASETVLVYDRAASVRLRWEEAAHAVRRLMAARGSGEHILAGSSASK
jgi:transcriptional regulator with XRE-family HTH domain